MIKKILKKAVQILLILLAVCIGLFLIMVAYVVIDDKKQAEEERVAEKTYTYEQLQKFTDVLNPLGTYFWDEFPELKAKYNLSNEESMILGAWSGLEQPSAATYWFFPNKLFYRIGLEEYSLRNKSKSMGVLIGIWFISDGILSVKIIGHFAWEQGKKVYKFCKLTETQLIDISDVDFMGYTKKPMAIADIPEDIKKQLNPKTLKYKPVRMARSLVSYNPFKEGDVSYGYFKYVRELAKENLSGEQIANSPELVYRFCHEFSLYDNSPVRYTHE